MVLFSAYTIVDGIFVSKGVGELALAGVNIALPFINVLSGHPALHGHLHPVRLRPGAWGP